MKKYLGTGILNILHTLSVFHLSAVVHTALLLSPEGGCRAYLQAYLGGVGHRLMATNLFTAYIMYP